MSEEFFKDVKVLDSRIVLSLHMVGWLLLLAIVELAIIRFLLLSPIVVFVVNGVAVTLVSCRIVHVHVGHCQMIKKEESVLVVFVVVMVIIKIHSLELKTIELTNRQKLTKN